MPSEIDAKRVEDAQEKARERGFRLLVSKVPNPDGKLTHAAYAVPITGIEGAAGRKLVATTSAVEAAKQGLKVLIGILDHGDSWP